MDGASEKRGLQNAETPSEWREKAGKSRAREHERQRERDGARACTGVSQDKIYILTTLVHNRSKDNHLSYLQYSGVGNN